MDRFLDMHMYITSALQKTDMKAVGLQLALDLLHKKVKLQNHNVYISIPGIKRLQHHMNYFIIFLNHFSQSEI